MVIANRQVVNSRCDISAFGRTTLSRRRIGRSGTRPGETEDLAAGPPERLDALVALQDARVEEIATIAAVIPRSFPDLGA